MEALIRDLLALADEAKAAGLAGAAGVLSLTVTGLRYGRETAAEATAQLRAFIAEDHRLAVSTGEPLFATRAGLYERAIRMLTPPPLDEPPLFVGSPTESPAENLGEVTPAGARKAVA